MCSRAASPASSPSPDLPWQNFTTRSPADEAFQDVAQVETAAFIIQIQSEAEGFEKASHSGMHEVSTLNSQR